MKKPLICTVIVFLFVLFLAGCGSKGDPEIDSRKILDSYLEYANYDSWQEEAYNINQQILLTEGEYKQYLEKRKQALDIVSTMLSGFLDDCRNISSKEVCRELDDSLKKSETNSQSIELEEVVPVKLTNNETTWQVSTKVKYEDIYTFQTVKFILQRKNKTWKIVDAIGEKGISIKSNFEERIAKLDKIITEIKENNAQMLNLAQKAKNDKCWLFQFNEKLTTTELEKEKEICYTGKYINLAEQSKNVSICDEIAEAYYKGKCYGQVAFVTNNVKICDDMTDEEYEARGFNELLSSRDICYVTSTVCDKIKNKQLKQTCLDYT